MPVKPWAGLRVGRSAKWPLPWGSLMAVQNNSSSRWCALPSGAKRRKARPRPSRGSEPAGQSISDRHGVQWREGERTSAEGSQPRPRIRTGWNQRFGPGQRTCLWPGATSGKGQPLPARMIRCSRGEDQLCFFSFSSFLGSWTRAGSAGCVSFLRICSACGPA